jgi:cold shock CspA family protein
MLRGAIARLQTQANSGYIVRPFMGAGEIRFDSRDLLDTSFGELHVGQTVEIDLQRGAGGLRAVQVRTVEE